MKKKKKHSYTQLRADCSPDQSHIIKYILTKMYK